MPELQPNMLFHNRYRLIEEKGRGSFGEVWLARDEQLDLEVAIKVYIALDDRGIEDFRFEFRTSWSLNHPNLLHAYHFDLDGRRPYLVMPFCPGKSTDMIGTTNETEIWKFIRDVSAGLTYLHDLDIIHHDIKPDNILKDANGNYLISDFGISTKMRNTLRRNSTRIFDSRSVGGALPYMGPETFSDNPAAVKATDIWALGVTLFEIATGELPFFGQGGGMLLHGAAIPSIKGDFSLELKDAIASCMAKETWERPTAKQLYEYAQAYLDGNWTIPSQHRSKDDPRKTKIRQAPNNEEKIGDVKKSASPENYPGKAGIKERNWFVSAWIILGMLVGLGFMIWSVNLIYEAIPFIVINSRIVAICSVLSLLGNWMMWRYMRWGYGFTILAQFLSLIVSSPIIGERSVNLSVFCINSLITFLILHIRKGGISAWTHMDGDLKKPRISIAYSLAMVAASIALIFPNGFAVEARNHLFTYQQNIKKCEKIIESSEPDLQSLMEARQLFRDIIIDENRYKDVNSNYNGSSRLRSDLNRITVAVAEKWAAAAASQARIGNTDKAIEFYSTALQLHDSQEIRSKFEAEAKKIAFIKPLSLELKAEGDYGETLYANKIKYLYVRMKYDALDMVKEHDTRLIVKIYKNGYLSCNTKLYSSSYSFHNDVTIKPTKNGSIEFSGWGNKDGGTYSKGSLRVEVWCKNRRLISKSATIH